MLLLHRGCINSKKSLPNTHCSKTLEQINANEQYKGVKQPFLSRKLPASLCRTACLTVSLCFKDLKWNFFPGELKVWTKQRKTNIERHKALNIYNKNQHSIVTQAKDSKPCKHPWADSSSFSKHRNQPEMVPLVRLQGSEVTRGGHQCHNTSHRGTAKVLRYIRPDIVIAISDTAGIYRFQYFATAS